MENENKRIIVKVVKGLIMTDTGFAEREYLVQIAKDDVGTSICIDDYVIPLKPLGIEIKLEEQKRGTWHDPTEFRRRVFSSRAGR